MPRIAATHRGTDPRGRPIWAPLVRVTVRLPAGHASGLAVLDSGADLTMVPFEIVAPLGVAWADLQVVGMGQGAGGTFERRQLDAQVIYERWTACDTVEVAEPGKLGAALLGRDFFTKFVIRFSWHTNAPTFDIDPAAEMTRGKRRK